MIVEKNEQQKAVLIESERFREKMAQSIQQAHSHETLIELRIWLVEKIYPALLQEFKYPLSNTEPIELDAPIRPIEKQHEVSRLKARLCSLINRKREGLESSYIKNDEIYNHKIALSQKVLGGEIDQSIEESVLSHYALVRGMSLADAAKILVASKVHGQKILLETERVKDSILSQIDAIRTRRDVQLIDIDILKHEKNDIR